MTPTKMIVHDECKKITTIDLLAILCKRQKDGRQQTYLFVSSCPTDFNVSRGVMFRPTLTSPIALTPHSDEQNFTSRMMK